MVRKNISQIIQGVLGNQIDWENLSWADIKDALNRRWGEKIKKYQNAVKNGGEFSWIQPDDSNVSRKSNDLAINHLIEWGIPLQVTGDPQKAVLFLCLFNPRMDREANDSSLTSIQDFSREKEDFYVSDRFNSKKDEVITKEDLQPKIIELERDMIQVEKDYQKWYKSTQEKDRGCYYSSNYYKSLLDEGEIKPETICNLELVPYRSPNAKDVNVCSTSYLTGIVILKRVYDYLKNSEQQKIFFVMRDFKDYCALFDKILKAYPFMLGDVLINDYPQLEDYMIKYNKQVFYTFSSRRGYISANNLVMKNDGKSEKVPEVFEAIRASIIDKK